MSKPEHGPTLAAVIPTHNRPKDLHNAVESVVTQGTDVEVVVVDDGSDPPVEERHLPPDVKVVRHDVPRGPAGARNAAVQATEAEWIAFLDDDDLWLPGKVNALLEATQAYPDADVIFHWTGDPSKRSDGAPRRVIHPLARILHAQPPHLSGLVVRRELHESVQFDETLRASEDIDYLIRLAKSGTWVEIPRVLSTHVDDPETETAINVDARVAGRLSLLQKHGDLISSDPRAFSFFYARLAHQYRRAGRRTEARRAFLLSLRLRPFNRLAWMGLVRTYAPWLPQRR
jgi:glycosyltransferase involved in cell wall biosynthesis